ncbi:hypothetical protein BDM02DRAFT_3133104 [Thelephora ganbajun]|uniref:Uncharacterized protein n=1 Tax=Thelephora ganbajun TaxID=370292 RepID=A0ACB6YYS8_THEGA|nr:hypothetical protein BDM02DRAFT_3133104 [Thelephora ganbajun]
MPALSFEERLVSGRYDDLASVFVDNPEALAAVDFGTHFNAESKPWPSNPKNYSMTFSLVGESRQELIVTLIGEVAKEGTELGPRSNAWIKAGGVILDRTSAKDVLVLKAPTLSPHALKVVFSNQVQTLEAIHEAELLVPPAEKTTNWIRLLEGAANGVVVTLPSKYRVPDDYFHLVKPRIKHKVEATGDADVNSRPVVELGGLYDPSLLPDFDPKLFGLVSTKLAQQEVFMKDSTLLPPWEMKDSLHPGTLVAVEAALIVYHFCGASPSTVFQVQARRVQILEESPLDIEPTTPPIVATSPAKRTPSKLFSSLTTPPRHLPDSPSNSSAPTKTSEPSASGPSKRRK